MHVGRLEKNEPEINTAGLAELGGRVLEVYRAAYRKTLFLRGHMGTGHVRYVVYESEA